MSLKSLVHSVLPQFPNVPADSEIEVLKELPTETLYLALKVADAEMVQWFFENALSHQVQGLIDLDCWTGDQFFVERFENYFKTITTLSPPLVARYTKELDPEVIVRGLMEWTDVVDFDSHEPIDRDEHTFLISPDNKYVLFLKTADPEAREMLYQWMNRLSAANLELMRRTLESLKWEQQSDLEEHGYKMKKGRLEEMGFVDYHEALGLYARGSAGELKKTMLDNPLDEGTKTAVYQPITPSSSIEEVDDNETTRIHTEFLPDILQGPLNQEGFLHDAFKQTKDLRLKEVLLMEIVRCINSSLSADQLLHGDIDSIGTAVARARKYLDLGLAFLSDNNLDRATHMLETQRVEHIFRLGWLTIHDLSKTAGELLKNYSPFMFAETDRELLEGLKGRHPQLEKIHLKELKIESDHMIRLDALLVVGVRLAQLTGWARFFSDTLGKSLQLAENPPTVNSRVLARLLSGLFRQSCGRDFKVSSVSRDEWKELAASFDSQMLEKICKLTAEKCPEPARTLLLQRLQSGCDDLKFLIANHPERYPDPRFFKYILLETT